MLSGWGRGVGCIFALYATLSVASVPHEVFQEELVIRPLEDGRVASKFSFTTTLKGVLPRHPETLDTDDDSQHYSVFPLALGQILREYAITEMHLTLNAGKWNYDRWGYPDEPGVGTGAELWAWMGDGGSVSVDHRWQGLRNALAGLFCASLGSLDEQRTTSPALAFDPEGLLPNINIPYQLRHASLASEHVCTENLTPFLKLLPCKSLSGIATLLNPHRLFDADWHGMGVHVSLDPDEGVKVKLTFQSVFNPVRSSTGNRRDWSFASLFDRTIGRSCPIAQSSLVRIELPDDTSYSLSPQPTTTSSNTATFNLINSTESLDVAMQWSSEAIFEHPLNSENQALVPLSIQRTLRGSSQARGELSVRVTNNEPIEIRAVYLETMPWFIQFYLHTLRVSSNGVPRDDLISNISYTPPVPHARPTTFQSIITLPPRSTIHLVIDVTKSFLRYTEHPPDAQRGWDLPPAVFVLLQSHANQSSSQVGRHQRIYTPTLLVDLATPDFSMPYNVIILSCTLMTLIFGSVFNLLTRKFVVVELDKPQEEITT